MKNPEQFSEGGRERRKMKRDATNLRIENRELSMKPRGRLHRSSDAAENEPNRDLIVFDSLETKLDVVSRVSGF